MSVNLCKKCGKPVGNDVFTVCDDCWDGKTDEKDLKIKQLQQWITELERKLTEPEWYQIEILEQQLTKYKKAIEGINETAYELALKNDNPCLVDLINQIASRCADLQQALKQK